MPKKSLKSIRAEEITTRFPNTGNTALADLLFSENPLLYRDKEDARFFIRSARGAAGKKMRKYVNDVKHLLQNGHHNPYDLPTEDHNDWKPLVIETEKPIRVGIISDCHFPFQDNAALTAALNYLKESGVSIIILNGDIIDCYSESSFLTDPSKRDMKNEIAIVKNFLSTLRKNFPKTRIIYKEGNHEFRHKAFLYKKAPELFGIEETRLDNLLSLKDFKIEWVDNKKLIELGKLTVVHGHEFGRGFFVPVNPARSFYTKAKKSVLGGHLHQVSSHSTKTINGHQHVAYSTGCLCDLTPEYAPINEWSHGFAIVDLNPDNSFVVHNKKFVKGKITNG